MMSMNNTSGITMFRHVVLGLLYVLGVHHMCPYLHHRLKILESIKMRKNTLRCQRHLVFYFFIKLMNKIIHIEIIPPPNLKHWINIQEKIYLWYNTRITPLSYHINRVII